MKKSLGFFVFVFLLMIAPYRLVGQCFHRNFSFHPGERIKYEVYYNWGLLWLNAGWVEFKVDQKVFKGRNVYFFDSFGSTYKGYDLFFKVRDYYKAYIDMQTYEPLWFDRKVSEGGFIINETYLFDHTRKKVFSYSESTGKLFSQDTLDYKPCAYDVLSLIYHVRNADVSKLKINDKIPLLMLIDNEYFDVYVRYLGTENMKTREGKTYQCLKFSALLVEGTIFKGGEDLLVWVTNDKNRVPVLVEAKILVGSVKVYLISTEGLRNPITSLVNK